ncbi:unnamed protein product [Clavelina lepadiformis]|uniref:Uncharacterized protein n=1 Tax=Clavelina lepadiformis TaxID=159417 RepID=A0ABP0GRE0_CLALP
MNKLLSQCWGFNYHNQKHSGSYSYSPIKLNCLHSTKIPTFHEKVGKRLVYCVSRLTEGAVHSTIGLKFSSQLHMRCESGLLCLRCPKKHQISVSVCP